MEEIQIIGVDEVSEAEKDIINRLANEYYEKLKRALKNEISVRIHIKEHSKAGKRHKSDIRVQLIAPTRRFDAQESDWDLAKALHKVFENIERQLQHKLRVDDQRNKPYA
jgi:ribosome-associated translation inhibitor RaiA